MNQVDQKNRLLRTQRAFIQSSDGKTLAFHNRKQERAFYRNQRLKGVGWTRRPSTCRKRNVNHRETPYGISVASLMAYDAQIADLREQFEREQQVAQNTILMNKVYSEE